MSETSYESYQILDCDRLYPGFLYYVGLAVPLVCVGLCVTALVRCCLACRAALNTTFVDDDYYKRKYVSEKQAAAEQQRRIVTYKEWEASQLELNQTVEGRKNKGLAFNKFLSEGGRGRWGAGTEGVSTTGKD